MCDVGSSSTEFERREVGEFVVGRGKLSRRWGVRELTTAGMRVSRMELSMVASGM